MAAAAAPGTTVRRASRWSTSASTTRQSRSSGGRATFPSNSVGERKVRALLSHPLRADIKFDEAARTFRYKNRVVPGLLRPLKSTVWPNYNFDATNTAAARRFGRRDTSLRTRSDGLRRGSQVHLEIETLTNVGTRGIRRNRRGQAEVDPLTRKILLAMLQWKWRPLASEVEVYDPTLGIATKVDLLCVDERGRLIQVETKTGYYASWNRGCGLMQGPFAQPISDSPQNQAFTQALFTKRMIEGYGITVDRAYVVRADLDGVTPYPLPRHLEQRGDILAVHVSQGLAAIRKQKERARVRARARARVRTRRT